MSAIINNAITSINSVRQKHNVFGRPAVVIRRNDHSLGLVRSGVMRFSEDMIPDNLFIPSVGESESLAKAIEEIISRGEQYPGQREEFVEQLYYLILEALY